MKEKHPYISSHAVERYRQLIGREVSHKSAVSTLQWAYFNGQHIKKEHTGACHIMIAFKKGIGPNSETIDGVLIASKQNEFDDKKVIKTVLSMDYYKANNSLTLKKAKAD